MRIFIIVFLVALLTGFYYTFVGDKDVAVIDAHYDGSTAQVIVDGLPSTESEKIVWWQNNQDQIRS